MPTSTLFQPSPETFEEETGKRLLERAQNNAEFALIILNNYALCELALGADRSDAASRLVLIASTHPQKSEIALLIVETPHLLHRLEEQHVHAIAKVHANVISLEDFLEKFHEATQQHHIQARVK